MKIKQLVFISIIIITTVFSVGLAGMVVGASLGANTLYEYSCKTINNVEYCESTPSFVYQGQAGYEGGGVLGLHIGVLVGLVSGVIIVFLYLRNPSIKNKKSIV